MIEWYQRRFCLTQEALRLNIEFLAFRRVFAFLGAINQFVEFCIHEIAIIVWGARVEDFPQEIIGIVVVCRPTLPEHFWRVGPNPLSIGIKGLNRFNLHRNTQMCLPHLGHGRCHIETRTRRNIAIGTDDYRNNRES
jgi:hypothetical protein